MMEDVFGGKTNERVLLYLAAYEDGYGRAISKTLDIPLTAIQRQLQRLEMSNLLISRLVGRTRVYSWNPRNPLVKPLRTLLSETLKYLSPAERTPFYSERRRPRRTGKPL
jgi:hypothetical protein